MKDTDFPAADLFWYDLLPHHIVATYQHNGTWNGPVPVYKGAFMPNTMRGLAEKTPLKIVVYGDSITRGQDASAHLDMPPFMPVWADLFVERLEEIYKHDAIGLVNAALPGATSKWGADYVDSFVTPLDPDLVIIAFGMNDFWAIAPNTFADNIRTIIDKIRRRRAEAEFILISSMLYDKVYSRTDHTPTFKSYRDALQKLVTTGVQLLDMTGISDTLYHAKKVKDCVTNPLHPNDYLARWYAQGLVAMLNNTRPPA